MTTTILPREGLQEEQETLLSPGLVIISAFFRLFTVLPPNASELPSSASPTRWCPSSSSETQQALVTFGSPENSQAGGERRSRCSWRWDHWRRTPEQGVDCTSSTTASCGRRHGAVGENIPPPHPPTPVTWQVPEITFLAFSWKLKCRRRGSGRDPSTLCFTGSGVGSCHGSAGGQPRAGAQGGCSRRDAALGAGWSGSGQKARVGRQQGGKARQHARLERWVRRQPRSVQGGLPWGAAQSSGA